MTSVQSKLKTLRERVFAQPRLKGAIQVIYESDTELEFREGHSEILSELRARNIPVTVLDFRTLVFEVLESMGLLQKAFDLDAKGSQDVHQNLSRMAQLELVDRTVAASKENSEAILWCQNTGALFPWVSFSAYLDEIENQISNLLILPFPGTEHGPELRFFGIRDGYNYRAARI